MVFWHHLLPNSVFWRSQTPSERKQTLSCSFGIHNSYFCVMQGVLNKRGLFYFRELFSNIKRGRLPATTQLLVSQRSGSTSAAPAATPSSSGCIAAQTPNLLWRLWPRWNASTNTQPQLALSLCCCHTHPLSFFFPVLKSLSLSLLDMNLPLPPLFGFPSSPGDGNSLYCGFCSHCSWKPIQLSNRSDFCWVLTHF